MSEEDDEYDLWFEESEEAEDDDEAEADRDAEDVDGADDDPETLAEAEAAASAEDDENDSEDDDADDASPASLPPTPPSERVLREPPCEVKVAQGDCLHSLAWHYKLPVDTIWLHADNDALRRERTAGQLLPGDKLFIPQARPRTHNAATETTARFKLKLPVARLKLKLLRGFEPRADVPFEIEVEGQSLKGRTDGDGLIDEVVPPLAREATLTVREGDTVEQHTVRLGHLDPQTAATGIQARLNNLGFSPGAVDGDVGERTQAAVAAFQVAQGLAVTGTVNDEVRQRLEELHES